MPRPPEPCWDVSFQVPGTWDGSFICTGEMGHSRSLVGAWPVDLRADGFAVAMDAPSGPLDERKRLRIPFGRLTYLRQL